MKHRGRHTPRPAGAVVRRRAREAGAVRKVAAQARVPRGAWCGVSTGIFLVSNTYKFRPGRFEVRAKASTVVDKTTGVLKEALS